VLATTTEKAWRTEGVSGLPETVGPEGKPLHKRPVMVSLVGNFTSYWKGKPRPGEKPPEAPITTGPTPEPGMGEAPAMDGAPAMEDGPAMEDAPAMDGTPAMDEPPAMEGGGMGDDAPKPPPAPEGDGGMAPDGPKGPEGAPGEPGAPPAGPAEPVRLDEGKGVLVILGDADTVSDDFSGTRRDVTGGATVFFNGVNGFLGLVPNVVDWLSGSDDLIALRSRSAVTRKLEEIEPDTASRVKTWNFLAAPLLVLLAGLFVFFVRRHRS
jgi:hypothetical protein